jgi:uncharacterized cofD-like protein
VVAIGGGAGLSTTLRAVRRYAGDVVAVVAMADDGGSTGRLRRAGMDVVPGDLRKCLVALAEEGSPLAAALDHRFDSIPEGPEAALNGHSVGNLLLAALIETTGDLLTGLHYLGSLLNLRGRVLPAALEPLTLVAHTPSGDVRGQVAVNSTVGIERVSVEPAQCRAPDEVFEAIGAADQIVLGPGSLFTSVLAALVVPGLASAVADSGAQVVLVANLRPQVAETLGLDLDDHLAALALHGVTPDIVLVDEQSSFAAATGSFLERCSLSTGVDDLHDPALLARALERVYRSRR